jgi:hypothetical protein
MAASAFAFAVRVPPDASTPLPAVIASSSVEEAVAAPPPPLLLQADDVLSTSSLDNDTNLGSDEPPNCESNADRQVHSPRPQAESSSDVEVITGHGGRIVKQPYRRRPDIGSFGLYAGNWGGRSRMDLVNTHLYHDLVLRNPAQVLVAQEVDEAFAALLKDPKSKRFGPLPPSSALAERDAISDHWMVLRGDEGTGSDGKSLLIAARKSLCKELQLKRWEKRFDARYRARSGNSANKRESKAYTRLMVANVVWNQRMYGRWSTCIANVHLHHKTAKKDTLLCLSN